MTNRLTDRMKEVLKQSGYSGSSIYNDDFSHSEILALYKKKGYLLDDEFESFLKVFADKRLTYSTNNEEWFLDFSIRSVLKSYPKTRIDIYGEDLALNNLIPFAYAYSGEIGLVRDQFNWVYGIDDDIVTLHGKDLWTAVNNILNGAQPKRIAGGS